ncbi:glycosyltransferase [Candidatus Sumerlaeota bacterium]|nr:glycosyltransferase [Candidatus Sumerlaeota bacterium]
MSDEKTPDKGGAVRALVISHLYPSASNPVLGIFVHEQVKALRKLGVDARVVSFRPMYVSGKNPIRSLYAVYWSWSRRKAGTWLDYEGVPVIYVPYWIFPWGGEVSNTLSLLSALALHKKRIRQAFPFQLIHAHTAMLGGMGAQLLKFGSGIPVVLTEHTGPFHRLTDTPIKMFLTSREVGRGYARLYWLENSQTIDKVSSLPAGSLIYSNRARGVSVVTGRKVFPFPAKVSPRTRRLNPNYGDEMREMNRRLRSHGGYVVYCGAPLQDYGVKYHSPWDFPSELELDEVLELRLSEKLRDGRIYELAPQ